MKLLNSLTFPFFLIFFISEPCQAFFQSEYIITDLENLDSTGFTSEANSWVYNGVPCPECIFTMPSGSSCDSAQEGQMVFGGPEATLGTAYFQKTYAPLVTGWNSILIAYEIWAFTTSEWSNAATLSLSSVFQNNMYSGGGWTLISSCSTDFVSSRGSHIKKIYKYQVQVFVSFGGPRNPISFGVRKSSSNPPASLDSVGIRNLGIYNRASLSNLGFDNLPCNAGYRWTGTNCEACYTTCKSCSGPGQDQCTACKSSYFDDGNGGCRASCSPPFERIPGTMKCVNKCSPGFYWARNQTCVQTCEEPLVQSLDDNSSPVCSSPCSDATQFVYPDGTCSSTCNSLLKDKSEPTIKLCMNPCQTSSMFVYPDGACVNTCPTPLSQKTENNVKYCFSACPNTQKFLYPDESCSATCDPPLTSNIAHGISSCSSVCSSTTEYLYPDTSCKACPTPFSKKTKNDIQYCENPCFDTQTFLYEDGTCKGACLSPSIAKDDPSIGKTCKFPCANVNHYYNTQTGKCTSTCEYPSEAIESPLPKLCKSSLSEEEVKQVKALANTANNANTASSTGAMIWSVLSSSDSTSACLGPLAKMLQYIKFMDIMFPEKVLILMDAQSKDSGFATKMMKNVLKEFPSHELPRRFKIYQSSSSFFVNLWPALFNLSVILLVTFLVVILTAYTKGNAKINGILKNVSEILKWNVFLITFSGSIGDIVLFTALEFQTMQFDNFAAAFSFLLCLGINTLSVLVVIQIIDVNSAIRKSKKTALGNTEEEKKLIEQQYNSYKALFECYKDYSFYQQIFLFVFLVRLALFNAIIGYFYNYPLFQATTAVTTNVLMLGYLVIKRPMKKLVNLIQQIVLEFVLLPFNVCVLALAIMDYHEIVDTNRRKSIGDVIVYINLIVPILSVVLMAAKAIVMAVDFYKTWKLAKQNKIKKLASVQKNFRPNDIFNTTEDLRFQSQTEFPSPTKSFTDHVQTLDLMDQSTFSLENPSVRSNPLMGNQIIRPLRPNFMSNHYNHQNLSPMVTSQNLMMPEYQEHQSPHPMRIVQENQYFQNETPSMMPSQINRMRINKRRDQAGIPNSPMKIKFGN